MIYWDVYPFFKSPFNLIWTDWRFLFLLFLVGVAYIILEHNSSIFLVPVIIKDAALPIFLPLIISLAIQTAPYVDGLS